MAKQRGIHQISGTINNLCYYEQKYVKGGLIRRVNEGMSGRLKTDPAFENTRLANREFGMCSIYAKQFLYTLGFRAEFVTYPSRQAQLTRKLLRILNTEGTATAPRMFSYNRQWGILCAIALNSIGKNRSNSLLQEVPYDCFDAAGEVIESFSLSSSTLERLMESYKCDRIDIDVQRDISIPDGDYSDSELRFQLNGDVRFGATDTYTFEKGDSDVEISLGTNSLDSSSVFCLLTVTFLRQERIGTMFTFKRLDSRSLYKLIYTGTE